ncbi:hypothetical protein DL93DRAFT_317905 [Clavulina sp. PMI_390]|nr:hypothetical protein DL93DRAFT_317905 [Clavulina sp. PMI_390]
MTSVLRMLPSTPSNRASRADLSSASSSSPIRSSPLNPSYRNNNPPSQRRASAQNHFQTQSRYVRYSPSSSHHGSARMSAEDAQKAFLREKFQKKCAARAERDRARALDTARSRGSSSGDHTRGLMSDDMETDDNEADGMDDPLYAIHMANERKREAYRQKLSFELAVGSSIDPDMEDFEEYENHFVGGDSTPRGPSPSPEDSDDYEFALPSDAIPSDLDAAPSSEAWSESQDADIDMPLSSPLGSPSLQHASLPIDDHSFIGLLLSSTCPYCSAPFSLYVDDMDGYRTMTCAPCTNSFPLGDAPESWAAAHPFADPSHIPLIMVDDMVSDQVLAMCSDDDCPWGVSL